MATNAVAWLLSYVYRDGVSLSTLVEAVDALRDSLKTRKRDTGFSGHSRDAVLHAVSIFITVAFSNYVVYSMSFRINYSFPNRI